MAEVNPEVGGGAHRAPSVDVARPKPFDGRSMAAGRLNPRLQTLAFGNQMKTAGAAEEYVADHATGNPAVDKLLVN